MSRENCREPVNSQILAEASEWLVELETGERDADTRSRFDDWLRRSPEHVRAYLALLPLWKQGAVAQFAQDQGPESLIAYASTEDNVVSLVRNPPAAQPPHRRINWRGAMAAAIVLALLGGLFAWRSMYAPTYTTAVGEQHSVLLPDGSTLELNARTRVRIAFNDLRREIELLQGQALFRVAPDPQRPFIVNVGTLSVRAIGTQFDVNRRASGTIVTVVEGRVSIAGEGALLSAGEQVTVSQGVVRRAPQVRPANIAAATAWTQRRLIFDASNLAEVAEEFNRYNLRPITIVDDALRNFPISGSFSSTDSASLLRFLEAQPGIRVVSANDEIRIVLRR